MASNLELPHDAAATVVPYSVTPLLETLLAKRDLSGTAAAEVMEAIIAGRVAAASVGALAIALRSKGESPGEIAAFAAP